MATSARICAAARAASPRAAALEPDRQETRSPPRVARAPIGEATANSTPRSPRLDAAKRSLADAREGHTHRLAELDAEQKRKSREIAQADGEILRGSHARHAREPEPHRGPAVRRLYQRIDRLARDHGAHDGIES